jgi:hypothetical protein
VLGVVRTIAGSDFNRLYAGIAIASPTVLRFCKANGCQVTLRGGQVVTPGTPLPEPVVVGREPGPRPRPELGDDTLRAFFAVGAELRLNTVVPTALIQEGASYSADILQTAKSNLSTLAANLGKVSAPEELRASARELAQLLDRQDVQPGQTATRAQGLEAACDEWVKQASGEERANYDLGAWLTELSVGLIKADMDVPTGERFLQAARDYGASDEVTGLLDGLLAGLRQLQQADSGNTRREVRRQADRLIGIGYIAAAGGGLSPDAKPQAGTALQTPPGDRNKINLQIP